MIGQFRGSDGALPTEAAEGALRSPPPQAREEQPRSAVGAKVSAYGVFAACWAAILPVAFLSTLEYPSFVPKYAVMLIMAAAGLVPLWRLTRRSTTRWVGVSLLGFLAVGLVSAGLSAAPGVGFFGLYRWGTGWLFWLACAGAFAVGALLRRSDLTWAFYGLLAGAIANAAFAVFQVVAQPSNPALQAYSSGTQADGFLGNPVHLEALMLGAIALVSSRACDSPRRWWWALLLFGVALELTSERVFIPILLVIFAVLVYRRRARGLVVSALVAAGCAIGYLGGGSNLGSRVTSGTAETTFGLRIQLWRDAARSLVHHLLIGSGPGQLLGGTAPFIKQGFGHDLGGRLFTDAHNFFVEVTVTTGLLGIAFFLAWFFGALRRARGPFLGFGLAVLVVKLVEPLNIGLEPLAFLALGAAFATTLAAMEEVATAGSLVAQAPKPGYLSGLAGRVVTTLSVLVALGLGATMLVGAYWYTKTQTGLQQLAVAQRANTLLPYWPESAAAIGFFWRYEYAIGHGPVQRVDLESALAWYQRSAGRDPADPSTWWYVAEIEQLLHNRPAAGAYLERSLRADPWYPPAMSSYASLEVQEHHWALAESLYHRLTLVRPLTRSEQRGAQLAAARLRG